MNREEAVKLLRLFTCIERIPVEQIPDRDLIRQALEIVREHCDYQILGICADHITQAKQALDSYIKALDFKFVPEIPPLVSDRSEIIEGGAIYVKYNPKLRSCHSDGYIGDHRGVLVSCQSSYDDDINEVFGHLPLDLYL